jgi:hypothetical protein
VTKKQHAPRLSEKAKKAPPEGTSTKKQPLRSSESDEKEAGGTTAASRRAEIERRRAEAQAAAEAEAAAAQLARVEKLRTELYPGGTVTEALAPLRWYVNGWLAEDFLGAIAAPPKAGKSFVALHLAICAARGERFYPGLEDFPRPLRVLYCAFEKPRTVRDRIAAHEQELGEIPRETFWLYAPRRPLALSNAQQVEDFAQLVKQYAPELIFFDTLARVEGDFEENSVEGTRGIVEALDKIRGTASLFFVHHEGKDSSKGMRGSSNLLASVDLVMKVEGVPATGLTVSVAASNAAEIPDPLAYAVKSVLLPPLDGEHEKRAVGLLYATSRPEIADLLAPRVITLLRDSFTEGASKRQLLDALNEDLSPGDKPVGQKSLGAALTQLKKDQRLYTSGKGPQTRWHAPYEEPEAERESF